LKKLSILKIVSLILFFQACDKRKYNHDEVTIDKDSIAIWIDRAKSNSYKKQDQLKYLNKAYLKTLSQKPDTISPTQLSAIAYRFYELNDTTKFLEANKKALNLAVKRKDSYVIGDAHWSYANYYNDLEIYDKSYKNYDIAYKYFNDLEKEYESARMLYSMSFIKGRYRDFSGSEVLNIEALKKFKNLNDNRFLYLSYNHLALLQKDIKEYDLALLYYEKAAEYLDKLDKNSSYTLWNLNNIGNIYLKKEEYLKALTFYNKALKENYSLADYAMVLTNKSYCRLLLNDTISVKEKMLKALKIRDSLGNKTGVIDSKIKISKFYEFTKDTINAVKYAKEANELALKVKNGGDYLTTLEQLADLQPNQAHKYLKLYSSYSDSLTNAERKTLNKFTRIEFETDEILETNKILTQQRIYIFGGSILLILILSLLYFIRVQRAKNEKLFLETEQQKANEQVYLLTLKQQATLEEERSKERNRISQELHDGILGRLFGTRVGLGFLDFEADEQTQEQHEAFLEELQDIEKEIREVSHKLNDNFTDPDVNFTSIVTQLLESKSQIGDFQFRLNIDENISWKQTDEIIKVNIYRIIQETLQNTIKHANAKNVTLDFSTNESQLWVQIKDDGVGFNLRKSRKGIGLKNMKSRVEKLNGSLEIQSAMNKGTQIHIKIPLV